MSLEARPFRHFHPLHFLLFTSVIFPASFHELKCVLTKYFRRTYPGENQGEDIREGFEPTDDTHAVDPKEGDGNNDKFRVDDDDSSESEEAREWKAAKEAEAEVTLKPKYGVEGEDFANVWSQGEPSSPPRENP